MRSFRKERRKVEKHLVVDEVDEFDQNDGNKLPCCAFTLAERYVRGELQIWVRLKVRLGVFEHGHYLAVFERFSSPDGCGFSGGSGGATDSEGGHVGAQSGDGHQQVSVLVNVVEVPEQAQTMLEVPSVVRLYDLKSLPNVGRDAATDRWQRLLLEPADFFNRWLVEDRELSTRVRGAPRNEDQLVGQMVERGSEIVNTIPDHRAEHALPRRRVVRAVDVSQSAVINLRGDELSFAWEQSSELRMDGLMVEFRSIYLDHDAVQRGWLPAPLFDHDVLWEGDAEEERRRADTDNTSGRGDTDTDPSGRVP